jgi:hypothetical protein
VTPFRAMLRFHLFVRREKASLARTVFLLRNFFHYSAPVCAADNEPLTVAVRRSSDHFGTVGDITVGDM